MDLDDRGGFGIPKSSAALVVAEDNSFSLITPKMEDQDTVPRRVALLTAMMIKAEQDTEWGDDLINEILRSKS